jgi:hypothetical protein
MVKRLQVIAIPLRDYRLCHALVCFREASLSNDTTKSVLHGSVELRALLSRATTQTSTGGSVASRGVVDMFARVVHERVYCMLCCLLAQQAYI